MKIYVSKLAYEKTIENLLKTFPDAEVNFICDIKKIDVNLSTHSDLIMCKLGIDLNSPVFHGDQNNLDKDYPRDSIYNGCCTENFFFHNTKITDFSLMSKVKAMNKEIIHINQGYTRCSVLPLGKNSLITSDIGIYNKCMEKGFKTYTKLEEIPEIFEDDLPKILLISRGHIKLKGFDYGFIGGCGGQVGEFVFFNGDINLHKDGSLISTFIEAHNLKLICATHLILEDIGSIICSN